MISTKYAIDLRLKRDQIARFDAYPFSLPAVRYLDILEFHPAVTFIVGENGSGKSTLLEAIAVSCGCNAEGGSKNFRFGTHASHSSLHEYIRIAKGFRRPKDGYFFLVKAGSQFIIATHSPILMAYPNADIYACSTYGLQRIDYQETEHYKVMHDFGVNPKRMLDVLLAPQEEHLT